MMLERYVKEKNVYDTNTNTKMFVDIKWNKQLQQEVHVDALCTVDDNEKKYGTIYNQARGQGVWVFCVFMDGDRVEVLPSPSINTQK